MGQAATRLRIISGGQTGVDRAALDTAIELDLPHGGWCPLGRRAEDGKIHRRYRLCETESASYALRTQLNVLDSDGTLIIFERTLRGGTEFTLRLAVRHEKPYLLIDLGEKKPASPDHFQQWLDRYEIATLNIAGPRESSVPGIYNRTRKLLGRLLNPRVRGVAHPMQVPGTPDDER